jgi:DNA adenine methylase
MNNESNAYFGGKSGSGTYQTIINQIPPHRVYVELFGGMLGIYRHKRPAESSIIFEKDSSLVKIYRERFGIEEYNLKETLSRALPGRTGVRFYNGCALEVFNWYSGISSLDRDDVFCYVDPPYPIESRRSGTKYKHELSNEEHTDLLTTMISLRDAKIALSTYPNELYDEFFYGRDEWRFIEFESQTRHGKATEQLWMNYPEPDELHDYRYLGEDYRERERISRKLKRWEANFMELSPLEQRAMHQRLSGVLDPTKF